MGGEMPAGMVGRPGQTVPGTLERPRTAGRRPPKVQSKVAATKETAAAPAAVITEGDKADDDDECFEEPSAGGTAAGAVTAGAGEQHGKLVLDLLAQRKQEEE